MLILAMSTHNRMHDFNQEACSVHMAKALARIRQGLLQTLPILTLHLGAVLSHACCRAGGKAEALAGIGQGLLQPFHVNRFQAGHSATDFPRWLVADDLYTTQYAVVSSKTCSAILL